jgi:dipeptidase E
VRLYLSSFRIGDHPEHLLAMLEGDGRAAIIANAMDEHAVRGLDIEFEARPFEQSDVCSRCSAVRT